MKKFIIAGMAVAMLAIPSAASADVPRCQETVPAATTTTATFHATQPSGGGGNWDHAYTVNIDGTGHFTGNNVITGLDAENMVTVNETVSGQITDKNRDGINEITMSAVRDSGFYTFKWTVTDAPMDGAINSMDVGTVSYVTAENWNGGTLPITFTAPNLPVATTDTTYANHGEYVSSVGGGKVAAQKCAGMPLVSKQGK
jgi:hypothetical protein